MTDQYSRSLFLFRRDLRIPDNTGLIDASAASETVVPSFIFDPRQASQNPYFSFNAFQFMIESLRDLTRQVAAARGFLCIFRGRPEAVVERLSGEEDIEAVFLNRDYTPFSRTRDAAIAKVCEERRVAFHCCSDVPLYDPGDVRKTTGGRTRYSLIFSKKRVRFQLGQSTLRESTIFQIYEWPQNNTRCLTTISKIGTRKGPYVATAHERSKCLLACETLLS